MDPRQDETREWLQKAKAVEARYPGAVMEISQQEAAETLSTAETMWDFVIGLLPDETHP